MGVGKTERLGHNDSRFVKGRRVDEANDRILRNLRVKGGKIRKHGDKWVIEVNSLSKTGTEADIPATDNTSTDGRGPGCGDCCNYKGGCDEPAPVDCSERQPPGTVGSGGGLGAISGGFGDLDHFNYKVGGFDGNTEDNEDRDHPGKPDPCA